MTLNELKSQIVYNTNKNKLKAFKELYESIKDKDYVCEEALISEYAEKLLEKYFHIYNIIKNNNTLESLAALRQAIIQYKSDNEVQEIVNEIINKSNGNKLDYFNIKRAYKKHFLAKGTKLSSFNLALNLRK